MWTRSLAAALVVAALSAARVQRPPGAQPGASAARAVVESFSAALQRGDSLRALRLLHPDLVVYESGVAEDLAHYRSRHLAADIAFLSQVRSRTLRDQLTVSGTMALYTREYRSQGTWRGKRIDSAGTRRWCWCAPRNGGSATSTGPATTDRNSHRGHGGRAPGFLRVPRDPCESHSV